MELATWWSLGTLAATAFLLHWTPRLTRPEVFFGVTVQPEFRDSAAGRGLTRIFRFMVWRMAALAGVAMVAGRNWATGIVSGAALWWLLIASSIGWYLVHRMARPYAVRPTSEREATLTTVEIKLPGNWLAKLGPFLMLGGVALYLHLNYDVLPDRFPVHWNIRGEADRFVAKSPMRVLQLPVVGLMMCGTLALTAFSISRQSKRISIGGSSAARESKFRDMNLWLLLGAQYYVACIFGWIILALRTPSTTPMAHYVLLAMAILPLPLALYLSLRYGQGGSRLADLPTTTLGLSEASGLAPVGDRTPDECWKLGQIYYNPNDAAVWVEKRAGVGYTFNFARPFAWIILLLMVFGPLAVIGLMEGSLMRMTKRSFLCLQLGWLCSGTASADDQADARKAVEEWLAIHDQARYDETWEAAANVVKNKVSKEQWVQSMQSALSTFGKLESRTLQSSRATDSLPGASNGKYVIFRYAAKFEKKASIVETIIPVMEDCQ